MAELSPDTQELFAQIGTRLKAAREERGYTLQEMSSLTRINAGFLEKIEAGDPQGLPGMAFVKGFIRNYISVLEIHNPELDEELHRLPPVSGRPGVVRVQASNPQVLDTEVPRPAYLKMALFVVLAVLILWAGYMLFRGRSSEPVVRQAPSAATGTAAQTGAAAPGAPAPAAPAATAPSGTPAPATPSPAAPSATAPSPAAPGGSAPGTPVKLKPVAPAQVAPGGSAMSPAAAAADARQKLDLTIRGLERTWVRLSLDRAPPIDVLMQPAETVAWEANQEIRLTIGRSNGVSVYLNGEEVVLPPEPNRLIPNLVLNRLTLLRLEN